MDNKEAMIKLLECAVFLQASKEVRPRVINKFKKLEHRLIVTKETTQSLYNDIVAFHKELGI